MINTNRIQTLTKEDLALFLANIVECGKHCPAISCCTKPDTSCKVIFLKWLNKEYNSDETLEVWDY